MSHNTHRAAGQAHCRRHKLAGILNDWRSIFQAPEASTNPVDPVVVRHRLATFLALEPPLGFCHQTDPPHLINAEFLVTGGSSQSRPVDDLQLLQFMTRKFQLRLNYDGNA